MKKIIITGVVTAILSVAITLLGTKLYNSYMINEYQEMLKEPGIVNVEEITFDFPKIHLSMDGIYFAPIAYEDIKDIQAYDISAVISDAVSKELYTYEGIKVKDLFAKYEIDDYKSVTFQSSGKLQVIFDKDEITDDMYLVFSRDGIKFPVDEPVGLLCPSLDARYSLTDIVSLHFE